MIRRALPSTLLFILMFGCSGGSTPPDWDDFVDRFLESHFRANPDVAVDKGRHEFDGLLPDWSEAGLSREIERLRSFREEALAFPRGDLEREIIHGQ